jgi:hypothetical protein
MNLTRLLGDRNARKSRVVVKSAEGAVGVQGAEREDGDGVVRAADEDLSSTGGDIHCREPSLGDDVVVAVEDQDAVLGSANDRDLATSARGIDFPDAQLHPGGAAEQVVLTAVVCSRPELVVRVEEEGALRREGRRGSDQRRDGAYEKPPE